LQVCDRSPSAGVGKRNKRPVVLFSEGEGHPFMTALRRNIMGSTKDRIAGAANSAVGKAKEAIGKETGDASLAAKGAAQDVKGKTQTAIGKGKAALGK
jgi:uncharacterized protein YjbJ (UPF0337 family)